MARRFPPNLLHALRNDVNIADLIENSLKIPGRHIYGKQRYECPKCSSFDTSIHPYHNLLRCFKCEINFNTIEIVMDHLKIDFVNGVNWMLQRYPMYKTKENSTSRATLEKPAHIGQAFDQMMPSVSDQNVPCKNETTNHGHISSVADPAMYKPGNGKRQNSINNRIDIIETKVDKLLTIVSDLKNIITNQN